MFLKKKKALHPAAYNFSLFTTIFFKRPFSSFIGNKVARSAQLRNDNANSGYPFISACGLVARFVRDCLFLFLTIPAFLSFLSLSLSLFYRVYKIFKSKQLTRAVYSDIWVLSRVFAAVSITLIIILIEIETVGWGSSRHTISSEEETSIKFFQTFTITRCAIAIICLFFFFFNQNARTRKLGAAGTQMI